MAPAAHLLDYLPSGLAARKLEAEHLPAVNYKDHHRMTTIDDTIEHVVRGHYSGDKIPVQLPHSVSFTSDFNPLVSSVSSVSSGSIRLIGVLFVCLFV